MFANNHYRLLHHIYKAVLIYLFLTPLYAEPFRDAHIEVELVSEYQQLTQVQSIWVALRLLPETHWHTYWQNPGDSGLATTIEWQLPTGIVAGEIQWPPPQRIDLAGIINYGFEGETFLLTELLIPANFPRDKILEIKAIAKWLVCETLCIPGEAALSLFLTFAQDLHASKPTQWKKSFDQTRASWPTPADTVTAIYDIEDGAVRVRLIGTKNIIQPKDRLIFYPSKAQFIEHSAEQIIERGDNEILIRQLKSPFLQVPPDNFTAVLTTENTPNRQAWKIFVTKGQSVAAGFAAIKADKRSEETVSLYFILLLAFMGGIILNLMPCVFPILSLKAISLLQLHHQQPREQLVHGVLYTIGVVSSFVIIAAILLALRAGGESIGWGFQLQSPWFVASLIYLLFFMGLSLSGFFQIGLSFMGIGQSLTKSDKLLGSFFTGVLATVVASPCTAPFMGTAMGFAMLQNTFESLLIFAVLGLGMALPFLCLASIPQLGWFMPKPGSWMEIFKQIMAYPLYLTAIWLLWVLGNQTDIDTIAYLLVGLVLLVVGIWFWQLAQRAQRATRQTVFRLLSILMIGLSLSLIPLLSAESTKDSAIQSLRKQAEPFSNIRLRELRNSGAPVFINLTADWCITCKVNEKLVLNQTQIETAIRDNNFIYMVGDWTNRNAEITQLLQEFGRSGVPLYLVYPAGKGEPIILPQILTPSIVITALTQ